MKLRFSIRGLLWPTLVVALCVVAVAVKSAFDSERKSFQAGLIVGQSKAMVRATAGEPAAMLSVGEFIEKWGNAQPHRVDRETWIYYVWPKSQHRFVLSFEGNQLVEIEHDQN